MLVGYNTNISYKGTVYHVQTEDSGLRNPHIITLLYIKGTILARKKVSYESIASEPDFQDKVREMMKEQHKAMIRELISGKHTPEQPAPQQAQEQPVPATAVKPQPETVRPAEPPRPAPPEKKEEPLPPAEEPKAQISKSLDDILLDYILKEEDNK